MSQALLSSIVALICQATSPCAFPNGYGRSRPETHLVYLHRAESSRLNNSVDSSHSPIRVLLHPSDGSHCRRQKSVSLQSACQCSTSSCHQAACCSVQCDQQERNNSSCPSRSKQVHSTLHLLWVLAQLSHAAHSRHAFKSGHLHPRETGLSFLYHDTMVHVCPELQGPGCCCKGLTGATAKHTTGTVEEDYKLWPANKSDRSRQSLSNLAKCHSMMQCLLI